jgi:hypothetical protein
MLQEGHNENSQGIIKKFFPKLQFNSCIFSTLGAPTLFLQQASGKILKDDVHGFPSYPNICFMPFSYFTNRGLKVPKCEIFDRSDFHDFYSIKPFWVGDFGAKI